MPLTKFSQIFRLGARILGVVLEKTTRDVYLPKQIFSRNQSTWKELSYAIACTVQCTAPPCNVPRHREMYLHMDIRRKAVPPSLKWTPSFNLKSSVFKNVLRDLIDTASHRSTNKKKGVISAMLEGLRPSSNIASCIWPEHLTLSLIVKHTYVCSRCSRICWPTFPLTFQDIKIMRGKEEATIDRLARQSLLKNALRFS